MRKNDWFYLLCGVLVALSFFRGCEKKTIPQPRQSLVDSLTAEIDSIQNEYALLLINRPEKIKKVREIRTKYVHDTLTITELQQDSTKLALLIDENRLCWEIISDDSIVIYSQSEVIKLQDSAITHLERITATQKEQVEQCIAENTKVRKKRNMWRNIAILSSLLFIAK